MICYVMEIDYYDKYLNTFGKMKNDDVSFQAFIKMLLDCKEIDDETYLKIKTKPYQTIL